MMQKKNVSWLFALTLGLCAIASCDSINKVTNNFGKKTPPPAVVPQKSNALAGKWKLNYITGPRITFDGLFPNKKPFLLLDSTQLHVSGNTGCNNLSGSYKIIGDSIHFGPLATTMMSCTEGAQGETVFLGTLGKVSHYKVSGDTLLLRFKKIDAMRFIRDTSTVK